MLKHKHNAFFALNTVAMYRRKGNDKLADIWEWMAAKNMVEHYLFVRGDHA